MKKPKKLTLLSLTACCALILSYVEMLLPPLFPSVPGIKMGLANIAVTFALYRFSAKDAALVSFVRIVLSALLFGSFMTFIYSAAGAALSICTMALLKKTRLFTTVGVSVAGGIMHNAGQVAVAAVIMHTKEIGYYMLPLTVSGIIAGITVGIASALILKYTKHI